MEIRGNRMPMLLRIAICGAIFFAAMFVVVPASAADTAVNTVSSLSAEDMLTNLSKQVPSLMRLVTAIAYVLGMYMIVTGIVKLKHFGEMRTQMSHEHSVMGPLVMLCVGGALLYLPSAVQVGLSTFWTEPNPYGYLKQQDPWHDFISVCFNIVQLIGTIGFIRGLVILSHAGHGQGGGQHGGIAKGITHIVGGILCINIFEFVNLIQSTLGLSGVSF